MKRQCVISICGYEGGLLGVSLGDVKEDSEDSDPDLGSPAVLKDLQTEYAMPTAAEGSI